jgi:hypothetical protein
MCSLKAFVGYGTPKPASLLEIERVLWDAIVSIAQGKKQPQPALLEALNVMKNMATSISEDVAGWFDSKQALTTASMVIQVTFIGLNPLIAGSEPLIGSSSALPSGCAQTVLSPEEPSSAIVADQSPTTTRLSPLMDNLIFERTFGEQQGQEVDMAIGHDDPVEHPVSGDDRPQQQGIMFLYDPRRLTVESESQALQPRTLRLVRRLPVISQAKMLIWPWGMTILENIRYQMTIDHNNKV